MAQKTFKLFDPSFLINFIIYSSPFCYMGPFSEEVCLRFKEIESSNIHLSNVVVCLFRYPWETSFYHHSVRDNQHANTKTSPNREISYFQFIAVMWINTNVDDERKWTVMLSINGKINKHKTSEINKKWKDENNTEGTTRDKCRMEDILSVHSLAMATGREGSFVEWKFKSK